MSPDARREFEAQWPSLEKRARSFLSRKQIPSCDQEDLVQEAAMRLLGMWDSIDQSRALWPLVSTILLNLIRDRSRCAPRHDVVALLPDIVSPHDVERAGLARVELDRVRRAMGHLSSSHRSVLMQELRWTDDVAATPAEKMLRMRARRKLRSILEKVSGLVVLRARRIAEIGDKVFIVREGAVTTASCIFCLMLGAGGVLVAPSSLTPKASAGPVRHAVVSTLPPSPWEIGEQTRLDTSRLQERVAEARRAQAAAREAAAREAAVARTSERERSKKEGDSGGSGLLPSMPVGDGDGSIPIEASSTIVEEGDDPSVTPPDSGDAPGVPSPPAPPAAPGSPDSPMEAIPPTEELVQQAEGLLG